MRFVPAESVYRARRDGHLPQLGRNLFTASAVPAESVYRASHADFLAHAQARICLPRAVMGHFAPAWAELRPTPSGGECELFLFFWQISRRACS